MKKTCEAPGCGKEFEAVRSTARFCCPACRVKASRAVAGPDPSTVKTAGGAGWKKVEETARSVGLPPRKSLEPYESAQFEVMTPKHVVPRKAVAAGDINALARQAILKVPVKRVEDDSIEARLKRLEQAMKQFASKKKPTKEQS